MKIYVIAGTNKTANNSGAVNYYGCYSNKEKAMMRFKEVVNNLKREYASRWNDSDGNFRLVENDTIFSIEKGCGLRWEFCDRYLDELEVIN